MASLTPSVNRPASFSWGRVFIYTVLITGAIISVIPFIHMIMTSLKSYGSVVNLNLWLGRLSVTNRNGKTIQTL